MPSTLTLAFVAGLASLPALGLSPPDPDNPGPSALLGPAWLDPVLPLPEPLARALADRDHTGAMAGLSAMDRTSLAGHQVDDLAFVTAWEQIRAKDAAGAVHLIEVVRKADHPPPSYVHLVVGELLLADDRPTEAALELEMVDPSAAIYPRARLALAGAYKDAGATAEGRRVLTALSERPDPAPGGGPALLGLAKLQGLGSDAAYPLLRRLWVHYPRSSEGRAAARSLEGYEARGSRFKATDRELALRAEALMNGWAFKEASALVEANAGRFVKTSEASCIAWYAHGRSEFKRNNVTRAAEILGPAGQRCAGVDGERGPKALYIAGKSLDRKKAYGQAAAVYQKIPELYPEHSMADDGYTLAGIGLQEVGKPAQATALWEQQVAAYPTGDMAAESFWRLAWNAYAGGDTEAAIRWAERMIWDVPLANDPVHVTGARYWAARWRVYPFYDQPDRQNPDAEVAAEGVRMWVQLCTEQPTRFYALLAASRLAEVDPAALATIPRPPTPRDDGTWSVRQAFVDSPPIRRGFALARLGLSREAWTELDGVGLGALTPAEAALVTQILGQIDRVRAHDKLHKYLLHHPPTSIGVDRDQVLRQAHPNYFWDEVQRAAAESAFDPRVFHALVREESSFNEKAKSWAGARGLCQLMPATARNVGGWLGIKVTDRTMLEPQTNLNIGARYLEFLRGHFDDNLFLAVAGYNAGEGNVGKWAALRGDRPTDEFIETIPFRETRHYVKRVLGTYQLYRVLYDPGPLFQDWSHTNHVARPG